jgi:hypothetical protein
VIQQTCPRCGRPARDGFVCHADSLSLAEDLREAAGHAEDAWTVIARQARYGGGSRVGRDQPLPVNLTASADRAAADNTITTWARHIADTRNTERAHGPTCATNCEHRSCDNIRYQQTPTALPEAARWLAGQLGWLRGRPEAAEAFDELHYACQVLVRLVDVPGRGGDRLVGMCDCGRILYAPHGRDIVQCRASNCGASWNVAESQQILRDHLDDRLVAPGEAAHLGAYLDTDRSVKQIHALVTSWGKRQRLEPHGQVLVKHQHGKHCEKGCQQTADAVATYRFGDIVDLMATTPRRSSRAPEMGA